MADRKSSWTFQPEKTTGAVRGDEQPQEVEEHLVSFEPL